MLRCLIQNSKRFFIGELLQQSLELSTVFSTSNLFPHRVLNTDNISIIGITMDYGPYGFLDYYDPNYLSQSSGERHFVDTSVLYKEALKRNYIEITLL